MMHPLMQYTVFFAAMAQHFGEELQETQRKLIETNAKLIELQDEKLQAHRLVISREGNQDGGRIK